MTLYRVDSQARGVPNAVFVFKAERGTVIFAAPIAKWMRGKSEAECVAYWKRRGAKVDLIGAEPDKEGS